MIKQIDKNKIRKGRHQRIRNRISGTADRPRMCVFRSLNNIYVQIIDDTAGHTLIAASSKDSDLASSIKDMVKSDVSKEVGKKAGKLALEKGISEVVFDRGGYLYTGRVANVADGAREAGLKL